MLQKNETIAQLVRRLEAEDRRGNTKISKYVTFNFRETLNTIDAYLNSKHISGDTDSQGREKPFFNIVTAAANIWYRATDIDRKNIKLIATKKEHYALAFIMSILLKEWMKKSLFGSWLNEWGRIMGRYGSALSKFVEKNGELIPEVKPWSVMIVDPVDFNNNVKIEKIWYTPARLRAKKEYDQKMVEELISNKQTRENMDGEKKDNLADFILVYEVHGELPESALEEEMTDEEGEEYSQQMHVISYIAKKEESKKFDDYTLYKGREKKEPNEISHLIKEDSRTLSIGAVENLFQAQWMQNHSVKAIKDQLDLTSRIIFQTADGNYVGRNALTNIENGDILIHKENQPLVQVNNTSQDITASQSFQAQWKALGNEINGISESMLGIQAKSGTAWRQTQAELQEAHSLFELMTENKGLELERIMRKHILPFLKKKMDNTDEISAILEEHQIKKLDAMFVPAEATRRINKRIKKDILNKKPEDLWNGNVIMPEQRDEMVANEQQAISKSLEKFGNQRFISPSDIKDKTWKKVLEDFEWEIDVDITGENKDTQGMLQTLTMVLQTIAGLQGQPMPEDMKIVFNKILNLTGAISPIELENNKTPAIAPTPAPVPAL